jgi:hypothetical protein
MSSGPVFERTRRLRPSHRARGSRIRGRVEGFIEEKERDHPASADALHGLRVTRVMETCSSCATIAMMQPADMRNSDDSTSEGRFNIARNRGVPIEREVRSRVVVVLEVRTEDSPEMRFVKDDDMIHAFSSYRSNQALRVGVGLRRRLHPMVPIRRDFFRSPIPSIHLTDVSSRWSRFVGPGARTASTFTTMMDG